MKTNGTDIVISMDEILDHKACRELAVERLATDHHLLAAMCKRLTSPDDEVEGIDYWGFSCGEVHSLVDKAREHLLPLADESAQVLANNARADREKHYKRAEDLENENWRLKREVDRLARNERTLLSALRWWDTPPHPIGSDGEKIYKYNSIVTSALHTLDGPCE